MEVSSTATRCDAKGVAGFSGSLAGLAAFSCRTYKYMVPSVVPETTFFSIQHPPTIPSMLVELFWTCLALVAAVFGSYADWTWFEYSQLVSSILVVGSTGILCFTTAVAVILHLLDPLRWCSPPANPMAPVLASAWWFVPFILLPLGIISVESAFLFTDRNSQWLGTARWCMTIQSALDGFVPLLLWCYKDTKVIPDLYVVIVLAIGKAAVAAVLHLVATSSGNMYIIPMDVVNTLFSLLFIAWVMLPDVRLFSRMDIWAGTAGEARPGLFLWRFAMILRYGTRSVMILFIYFGMLVTVAVGFTVNERALEVYDTWIAALWLWIVDTVPFALLWLSLTSSAYSSFRLYKQLFAEFNLIVLALLLGGAITDLIKEATEESPVPHVLWFWCAKLGAKWLLVLFVYELYLGLRSVRTWASKFALVDIAIIKSLEPWHTLVTPVALLVLVILHVAGWVGQLWETGITLYKWPIYTGILAFVLLLSIPCIHHIGWIRKRFSNNGFRVVHWCTIVAVCSLLVIHGWQALSGIPYFWASCFLIAAFVVIELFFSTSTPATLLGESQLLEDGATKIRILLLQLTNTKKYFRPGQTVLVHCTRKTSGNATSERIFMNTDKIELSIARTVQEELSVTLELHMSTTGENKETAPFIENNLQTLSYAVSAGFWGEFARFISSDRNNLTVLAGSGSGCAPLCGLIRHPDCAGHRIVAFLAGGPNYIDYLRGTFNNDPRWIVLEVIQRDERGLDEALSSTLREEHTRRVIVASSTGRLTPWNTLFTAVPRERPIQLFLAGNVRAIYTHARQAFPNTPIHLEHF